MLVQLSINTTVTCWVYCSNVRAVIPSKSTLSLDSSCLTSWWLFIVVKEARLESRHSEERLRKRRRRWGRGRGGRGRRGGGGRGGGGGGRGGVKRFPSSLKTAPWVSYLATSQWIIMKHSISLTTLIQELLIIMISNIVSRVILWQHIDIIWSG